MHRRNRSRARTRIGVTLASPGTELRNESTDRFSIQHAAHRLEERGIRLSSYAIVWSRTARAKFRLNVERSLRGLGWAVYRRESIPSGYEDGRRVVEERISVFGVPIRSRVLGRGQLRVALLVDEFFGACGTAIGGYGALARKYICRYIPSDGIRVEVILNTHDGCGALTENVDGTLIHRLPGHAGERQRWLAKQGYDLFLSIEMTDMSFRIISSFIGTTPLLYWIQDPRDLELYQPLARSVQRLQDDGWDYLRDVAEWIPEMLASKRIDFVSQGPSLSSIARKLYNLSADVPIADLPNPVDIDFSYCLGTPVKEDKVVFLGRLEAQKRAWIACEIAKRMPNIQFYILGATGAGRDESANRQSLAEYRRVDGTSNIPNLHFVGHVDGAAKNAHLATAKLLINTSIWEGIPVSWLEALSYGTLVVSAFDRDNIVSRFGTFVGEVQGDGVDEGSLIRFASAISEWINHDPNRVAVAQSAIDYVRRRHSVATFTASMRAAILETAAKNGVERRQPSISGLTASESMCP